jgi:hypothetical protein
MRRFLDEWCLLLVTAFFSCFWRSPSSHHPVRLPATLVGAAALRE